MKETKRSYHSLAMWTSRHLLSRTSESCRSLLGGELDFSLIVELVLTTPNLQRQRLGHRRLVLLGARGIPWIEGTTEIQEKER